MTERRNRWQGHSEAETTGLGFFTKCRVPEKEKLKINLSYLSWKTERGAMPSVKWVSDEFGLGFIIGRRAGRPFLISGSFQLTGS